MNEKFFDLPREKQDRMINGALEVFAKNGFKHASTDEMVRAVEVSKGLWFHYFGSKAGLYVFVYEYSVKYVLLEFSTVVDENEKDFFEIIRQMVFAAARVSKNYPFMMIFLEESANETETEVIEPILASRKILFEKFASYIKNAEIKGVEDKSRRDKIKKIVNYMISGITREKMFIGTDPDAVYKEIKSYLDVVKNMTSHMLKPEKEEQSTNSASAAS